MLFEKLMSKLLAKQSAAAAPTDFIYVLLPANIYPEERGDKFEDPIDAELKLLRLGEVSGGGSLMSEEHEDGSRHIIYCGIDIDTTDLARTRSMLRELLPELGCPVGTEIQFDVDSVDLIDKFDGEKWLLDLPNTGFEE